MRQPSTYAQLHAWWSEAIRNPDLPRSDGFPEAGFYRLQHVRGGPYVPVRIFVEREVNEHGELDGPERLVADVAGERRDPCGLWLRLTPISRAEHAAITARAAMPGAPDPTRPLNVMRTPKGPSNERYV
jgi:hypothetical protein